MSDVYCCAVCREVGIDVGKAACRVWGWVCRVCVERLGGERGIVEMEEASMSEGSGKRR